MKTPNIILLLTLIFFGCKTSPNDDPTDPNAYSTANILCDLSNEVYNDDESVKLISQYAWDCDATNSE